MEEYLPSESKTSTMGYLDYSSQTRKNNLSWFLSLDHSPIQAIPPALNKVQPGENESARECLSLIVEPGPFAYLGHSSVTKQSATWREWICPREWLSCTNLQNGPFFETTHNCELRNNDCPARRTSLLDHYWEWPSRRETVLDHSLC